jgi:death-on-curing family protein
MPTAGFIPDSAVHLYTIPDMADLTPSSEAPPQPPISRYLTMDDLLIAHVVLAEVFKDDPEPVPDWDRADQHRLSECRACIEVEAFGVKKYPDLPSAVAKLFYSTIKLHAFPNGNKRFALVLSLMLLVKNGYVLTAPSGVGANIAKLVADADPHNPPTAPDAMITALAQFYAENMEPYRPAAAGGDQDAS